MAESSGAKSDGAIVIYDVELCLEQLEGVVRVPFPSVQRQLQRQCGSWYQAGGCWGVGGALQSVALAWLRREWLGAENIHNRELPFYVGGQKKTNEAAWGLCTYVVLYTETQYF